MFEKLLSEHGLSLDRLHTLCLVAEKKNVTHAAGGDPSRQSQFSRQIHELENYFGVELIRRKGRGVTLTEHGKILTQQAKEFFQSIQDFKNICQDVSLDINIVASNSALQWLLLPNADKLTEIFPHINFTLMHRRTSDVVDNVLDLSCDFGVTRKATVPPQLNYEYLKTIDYSLFIPKKMYTKLKKPNARKILESIPVVMGMSSEIKALLKEAFTEKDFKFKKILYCSSNTQAVQSLSTEKVAVILPDMANQHLHGMDVVQIDLPNHKFRTQIGLIWNPRLFKLRPATRSIKDKLVEILKKQN
jgi:DNA-binding transcriptional LysR family regulator